MESLKEKQLKAQRENYHKHRDKRLVAKKIYGEKNREKILLSKKTYYRDNINSISAKRKLKRDALAEYINTIQQGHCAICNKPEHVKNSVGEVRLLNKDHDHSNGLNRDYLCLDCNTGLGKFYDDPTLLRKAAEYIERWKKMHQNL